ESACLAPAVPGREPRPRVLPRRRPGPARSGGEPPRRLRSRHPPLHRFEPGPHGAAGRARGVDATLPRLRAHRPRPGDMVGGPGARPALRPGPDRARRLATTKLAVRHTREVAEMDWSGWALFGLLATAILTAIMISAPLARGTR